MKSQLSKKWLILPILSLLISGIYSVIIVFARTPAMKELFIFKDLFRKALIIHVDLSQVFWMLLTSVILSIKFGSFPKYFEGIFYKLFLLTLVLVSVAAFSPYSEPILNNYIPMLDNSISFSFGLALFLSLLLIINVIFCYIGNKQHRVSDALCHVQYVNQLTIIFAFVTFLLTIIFVKPHIPELEYYEYLYWGFGHILQFVYVFLMIIAWYYLASYKKDDKCLKNIASLHFGLALISVLYFFFSDPGLVNYKGFYTQHMIYCGGVAAFFAIIHLLKQNGKALLENKYENYFIVSSIFLFLMGGFIGLLIRESNTVIPAHYHGSVVAITVALMGLTFKLIEEANYGNFKISKLLKAQPVLYISGQFLHISGLAISGGYGALRKSPDSITNFAAKFWMGIMGLGGLLAIISGFIFVYLCYKFLKSR